MSKVTISPPPDFPAIMAGFPLLGRFRRGAPYGSGHINDTFEIVYDQAGAPVRYLLQRINARIFDNVPLLMENIERVTKHLGRKVKASEADRDTKATLTLVSAIDGKPYFRDDFGAWWRCYLFIERAKTYDLIETPLQASEAAYAFGEFQNFLTDLPGKRLHETIPEFHHTRRRFNDLIKAVDCDQHGRLSEARDAVAFAISREGMVDVLLDLAAAGEIPERITHNDTKLNNVMLSDTSQTAVCVIDLDTVMPGLALYDFGDMVRSGTNSGAEDERDVSKVESRLPIFEALVSGYLKAARPFLTEADIAHLTFSGRLITLEIGMRFLTDYLMGDKYFKTTRANQNLDRARNQFALLRSLETQESAMEAIVRKQTHTGNFARNRMASLGTSKMKTNPDL